MNLKNNGYKQVISLIILTNFVGLGALFLLIRCYLETKSSEYLYGLFFLLFFVLMDLLFYAIRIFLFSKVVIEDGKIKEKFFKRTIKEIDLKDIHLLYVDADNLCVSSIEEPNIKFINQFAPIIKNKNTILFRMNLKRIAEILEPMEVDICYVSNRVSSDLKDKISMYFNIHEIEWMKKSKC